MFIIWNMKQMIMTDPAWRQIYRGKIHHLQVCAGGKDYGNFEKKKEEQEEGMEEVEGAPTSTDHY